LWWSLESSYRRLLCGDLIVKTKLDLGDRSEWIRVKKDPTLCGLHNGDVGFLCRWPNFRKKSCVFMPLILIYCPLLLAALGGEARGAAALLSSTGALRSFLIHKGWCSLSYPKARPVTLSIICIMKDAYPQLLRGFSDIILISSQMKSNTEKSNPCG
jgi:hypothetical protein